MNRWRICIISGIFITLFLNITFAEDLIVNTNTTWTSREYAYDNVTITNGATLVFDGAVTLNATNLTIDAGSSISADGKGYPAGQGPGTGEPFAGGSYGGRGGGSPYFGTSSGPTYGSALVPVDLGSGGGGIGGSGGGIIRLNVFNILTVNGKITTNGTNGGEWWGGGSGGSIFIIANTLEGSGLITANGGNGGERDGGGGGGRVAIYYENSVFTGNAEAKGGTAGFYGSGGEDGTVVFLNTLNNTLYTGHSFRFQENDSPFNFNKVILNNSRVTAQGNISLTVEELSINDGSNLTFTGSQILNVLSLALNRSSTLTFSGEEILSINTLTLTDNSLITHSPQGEIGLTLTTLIIDSTSSISADGKGYLVGQGPGTGEPFTGGSYGGRGGGSPYFGTSSGPTYGSALVPVDLGSGGGGLGGSGGGIIRLNVFNILTVNGKITANGTNGGEWWGGGSGGSIFIIANTLEGSGLITANGGNGGERDGGGGGGRVAIYYERLTFTGNVESRGGAGGFYGSRGEDGTVVIQGSLLNAPLTFFTLSEKSSTFSTSSEVLLGQEITLNNAVVSGDLNGTLNFTKFEIVQIDTGSFAGKGFSKGEFTANLEGISYNGTWKGVNYFVPSENKIYLKGEISGDISGISEGFLVESNPGSGIYDKYQSTWKLNSVDTDTIFATINLEGSLTYQSSYAFTSELYLYQANMEGSASGHYTGPLSAVMTHLRLVNENEYQNEGLSILSYNCNLGSGEGWAYNQLASPARVEFNGLFKEPILGKLSAFLEETRTPKTLSGTIERMDLGVEPAPLLSVKVWGPQRVSPGQKVDYIIEYRNDGLKSATEAIVYNHLSYVMIYISASQGAYYDPYAHQVSWNLGTLPAKSAGYLSIQAELPWGLSQGLTFENSAYILDIVLHSTQENGFGNGIDYNSENVDEKKQYQKFASLNNAEWIELYDKTNPITGALEAYLASKDVRTSRNGVGENDLEIPGPLVSGYRPKWILYSGGTTTAVNQAKNNRLSGDELYLISTQSITQEDVQAIKSKFGKIVVYQGDDLVPDEGITIKVNEIVVFPSGKLFREQIIRMQGVEDLIRRIENTEGNKTLRYLEYFLAEPGNRIKVTWEDGTTTEFIITHVLQSEEGIEVLTLPGIKHEEWIPVLTMFMEKYKRLPTGEDLNKLKEILEKFRRENASKSPHIIAAARDPNEKLVYPEGDIKPGDRLDYTINYENEGEGIAFGVYITDTLDRDLDDSTLIINNNGTYDSNTRNITWFIGEVGSHQKGSVTLSVNTKSDLPNGTEIINFATVYFPSVPEMTRTNGTVNRIVTAIPDTTPPVTTLTAFPVPNQSDWNNTNVTITLTAEDPSGVKEIHYTLTGAEVKEDIVSGNTTQIVISTEGITNLTYWAVDNVGNIETAKTLQIKIDKTPPTLSGTVSPEPNFYGWNNTDVIVTFTATDSLSGIATITEPINVTSEGANQYIPGEAIDFADNRATTYVTVNIDKTPPQVSISAAPNLLWPPNHKMVNVSIGGSAIDALSGIASTTFEVVDEYGTVEPTISDFGIIISLEAWRNGDDLDGRVYNVSVTTKDKADNEMSANTTVICPHDMRKK